MVLRSVTNGVSPTASGNEQIDDNGARTAEAGREAAAVQTVDGNRDERLQGQYAQSRSSLAALRIQSGLNAGLSESSSAYRPIRTRSVRNMPDEIDIVSRKPGRPEQQLHIDAATTAAATATAAPTTQAKTVSLKAEPKAAIKDLQTVASTINVTDDMTIDDLKVTLDINHTWRGDLRVTLTSPAGQTVTLHNRTGGSLDNLKFTADRSEFDGKIAKGKWTLTVKDEARGDVGVLNSWKLDIAGKVKVPPPPPPPPQNNEVVVAVFDGGVDFKHVDLDDNMWKNKGEVAGDGLDNDGNGFVDDVFGIDASDKSGNVAKGRSTDHGTHVAGIIAAEDNGEGVTGVAAKANVKIMALGGMYDSGTDGTQNLLSNFETAVDYVVKMKKEKGVNVRVVNCSFAKIYDDEPSKARWSAALKKLEDADILLTASGGNTGTNVNALNRFPNNAPNPNIITVAALDTTGEKLASFSSYGDKVVELAAPGDDILSTVPGNAYEKMGGTSMAAPHVAGAAALLFARYPQLTAAQARGIIESTVDYDADLEGKVSTKGKLNIEAALAKAAKM